MKKSVRQVDENFALKEIEFVKKPAKSASIQPPRLDVNLTNSGMYVAAPILLGLAIGYFADEYFKTKPLFILIFIIGGAVSAFYNLYRLAKPR